MIRVRIQYDKYNRTFKLVDKEFGPLLDDGEVYDLLLPIVIQKDEDEEQPVIDVTRLAHA